MEEKKGLVYIGGASHREVIDFIPAHDLSPEEAAAYAAEFGGLDKLIATGIYAAPKGKAKPAAPEVVVPNGVEEK